jgi:hypothetical protein
MTSVPPVELAAVVSAPVDVSVVEAPVASLVPDVLVEVAPADVLVVTSFPASPSSLP